MQIAANTVVLLNYLLTNPEGEELDKSQPSEPFAYLHGYGGIIPGLEKELAGKQAGDAFRVTIPPSEAYGERDESLVTEVQKDLFEDPHELQPGMRFMADSDQGGHLVVVVEVGDETVTIDANEALAGVPLTFEVEVVDVRQASAEEIEHGHAHGPGGHHHG